MKWQCTFDFISKFHAFTRRIMRWQRTPPLQVALPVGIAMSCIACKQNVRHDVDGQRHTPLKSRANKQRHLSGTNEGFVDTKEALALELDDGPVLHVAKSGLSHSERRLAAVRVDEVLHVFALKNKAGWGG
jgi:hypothetical protein